LFTYSYMFSCIINAQVTFVEKTQLDKYLHEGSLEITLKVP